MNIVLRLLVWVGLTRRKRDGSWFVPFGLPPKWTLPRTWVQLKGYVRWHGWSPYLFRNRCIDANYHRRKYNRLLPFRWGISWMGFEIGDRGGEHVDEGC